MSSGKDQSYSVLREMALCQEHSWFIVSLTRGTLSGEVLELPPPLAVSTGISKFREFLTCYGMGFDSSTNSFKIFWACELTRTGLSRRLPKSIVETEVYTLGTSSW